MEKHEIQSPLPGPFYRRSSPDASPYKESGDRVSAGEVIGLIEVMKQFTELTAEVDGTVGEFLVEDGDAVEPGQVIAVINRD